MLIKFFFSAANNDYLNGLDNESGLVDRVSKNNAFVFLEILGYTIKLNSA